VRDLCASPAVEQVFVVDNGSRDRTAERARAAGAVVLSEPRPGYGAALRAGIGAALDCGFARVVLSEADGTFDPGELERLLGPLSDHALVLGSRASSLPLALRLGNRAVAALLSALWWRRGIPLTDVGCTYRALTAEAWRELAPRVTASGPEFAPQMVCAAFDLGLAVRELPVRYLERRGGESKHGGRPLAVLRTALRMLRAILRERLRRGAPGGEPVES